MVQAIILCPYLISQSSIRDQQKPNENTSRPYLKQTQTSLSVNDCTANKDILHSPSLKSEWFFALSQGQCLASYTTVMLK